MSGDEATNKTVETETFQCLDTQVQEIKQALTYLKGTFTYL